MAAPDPTRRFIKEYAICLEAIEPTLRLANRWLRRRAAVRIINDRLADLFLESGRTGHKLENISSPTRRTLRIIDDKLQSFVLPTDLRVGIIPEMLGITVERFAVEQTRHGVWYTPSPVVEYICREALAKFFGASISEAVTLPQEKRMRLIQSLSALRIIDPACGCGAFLVGMYRELCKWRDALLPHIADVSFAKFPLANLHGFDLDDLAVHTTRLRLRLEMALNGTRGEESSDLANLQVADALDDKSSVQHDHTFDIVVTNPPFGVTAPHQVRDRFFNSELDGPQSRDAYALFVARSLELLKDNGVLGILMSNTWRTIRRHRPLRKRLLESTTIHTLIDLPGWIFPATVNTGILLLSKKTPNADHQLVAVDLRSAPSKDWNYLQQRLDDLDRPDHTSNGSSAVYTYPQMQIRSYENLSFFIASPRLHAKLSDGRFTTLGEIAEVRQGLATGDNKHYLRKHPSAHGNYQAVEPRLILTERELTRLSSVEKLNGVDPDRYSGRHFVPYDKGGASDSEQGWLPNYYVPTGYFIDWSHTAVRRMKTTRSVRQRGKVAARFQNSAYYFRRGLTFSYTGYYAPCFRLSSGGVFDVGGSSCFDIQLPLYPTLAILASKVVKYIARNFIDHTVNFQVDEFKALPVPRVIDPDVSARLETLVTQIVEKQHTDPRYLYHLHEQVEIDRLVYQLFELTEDDVQEVEEWWERRYGRMGG